MRIGELAQASGTPIETIRFYDKGSAATNNITLTRAGSDTIGGDTTLVIDVNRACVTLVDGSATWAPVP